jgi:hypothetical protein
MPLITFYEKHGAQVKAKFDELAGRGAPGSHLGLDLADTALDFIKKHWPAWNEDNLIDDFKTMIHEELAPEPAAGQVPPRDQAQGDR